MRRTHVYIVGAGFSKYAGLPLQKDFTEALLAARADEAHPMQPLIGHLGRFVHDAFDHNESAKAKFWPNLEDVFTNIDPFHRHTSLDIDPFRLCLTHANDGCPLQVRCHLRQGHEQRCIRTMDGPFHTCKCLRRDLRVGIVQIELYLHGSSVLIDIV
jgi:hypothetical protein